MDRKKGTIAQASGSILHMATPRHPKEEMVYSHSAKDNEDDNSSTMEVA